MIDKIERRLVLELANELERDMRHELPAEQLRLQHHLRGVTEGTEDYRRRVAIDLKNPIEFANAESAKKVSPLQALAYNLISRHLQYAEKLDNMGAITTLLVLGFKNEDDRRDWDKGELVSSYALLNDWQGLFLLYRDVEGKHYRRWEEADYRGAILVHLKL